MKRFAMDHFDHFLLAFLGVLGAGAGIWCAIHKLDKPSEWCFVEAAAAVSALFMRMNSQRAQQTTNAPTDKQVAADTAAPAVTS
jgi:hypothetical protein